MSYNYDRSYLDAHSELVSQLIAAWHNGSTLESSYVWLRDLRNHKALVRSLLANIAFNIRGCETIRQDMLTWTTFKGEMWHLHIGAKRPDKAKGGKPTAEPQFTVVSESGALRDRTGTTVYPDNPLTRKTLGKFFDYVTKEGAKQYPAQAIRVDHSGDLDFEMLQAVLGVNGYSITVIDGNTFVLTRITP